jgi:hypothetical protein
MDVGFQQTAEEYYTNKVREIISSVIIALQENPKRKFSFSEIYFFQKWWDMQSAETKKEVF